jgi:hypothetical protein
MASASTWLDAHRVAVPPRISGALRLVEGEVPAALRRPGTALLRNGPATFLGDGRAPLAHVFDGDGLLRRFDLGMMRMEAARVTPEGVRGRGAFGTPGTWPLRNPCNAGVCVGPDGAVWALGDGGPPRVVTWAGITACGTSPFGDPDGWQPPVAWGPWMSPRRSVLPHPKGGMLMAMAFGPDETRVELRPIPRVHRTGGSLHRATLRGIVWAHDWALCLDAEGRPAAAVLLEAPTSRSALGLAGALLGTTAPTDAVMGAWATSPASAGYAHVIWLGTRTQCRVTRHSLAGVPGMDGLTMHLLGAHACETGGVAVDAIAYPREGSAPGLDPTGFAAGAVRRFRLFGDAGDAPASPLPLPTLSRGIEFPTLLGPYEWACTASARDGDLGTPQQAVAVVSLPAPNAHVHAHVSCRAWSSPHGECLYEEPVPAGDAGELLLTCEYDPRRPRDDRVHLLALETAAVEQGPVARIALPAQVPLGLHGCFVKQGTSVGARDDSGRP